MAHVILQISDLCGTQNHRHVNIIQVQTAADCNSEIHSLKQKTEILEEQWHSNKLHKTYVVLNECLILFK